MSTRYIDNAIRKYGLDFFNLIILEKIDITNLTTEEIKKKILNREQFYLDFYKPKYNIRKLLPLFYGGY